MPHQYDTGLWQPQRTALRAAILTRLSVLRRPALYVQRIVTLAHRLADDDDDISRLDSALAGAMPGIALVLGNGETEPAGNASNWRKRIEIFVYVVSSNARGLVEGRLQSDVAAAVDVTKDPGVETMLEHVEQALAGVDLGIAGVEEIRPESETEAFTTEQFTVWELSFSVRVDRSINHDRGISQLIDEIDATHTVGAAEYVTRTEVQ